MRITFVLNHADLTGGVRVVAIYAKRLSDRGHDVTVVSRPKRQPTFRERVRSWTRGTALPAEARPTPSHLDSAGVNHHVIDSFRPIVASDLPDADVVIATWWETAEWVLAMPPAKGAKVYFIQHFEIHQGLPIERVEATWRMPMHRIVVAQWLADISEHRYHDRDCSLVPNSVDTDQFYAPPRGKQSTPTVGLMYSLVPFKGCDISLKAIDLVRQSTPTLKVMAFGNRHPEKSLPLGPNANFAFQPRQDRIKDIYAACDCWLVGSRSEGFGLPILEAMACRTPVIATPAGAAPELVGQGGGVLVHSDDPHDMAKAIRKILTLEGPAWTTMSDLAFATVARFTWDDATDKFLGALETARLRDSKRRQMHATAG